MPQQSVLITGCSDDGIGYGLALTFQQRGYLVFATTRDAKKMSKLQDLPNVTLLALDVTEPSQIAAAAKVVSNQTGGTLDYLINNAGRNHFMPILDEDLNATRAIFETNVWGPVAVTQAFAPLLIKAKGNIVFITSISGYVNVPWMGSYAASKRSIEIIAETLRLELGPFNVGVLSIVTGAVKTQGQTYFGDFKLPSDSLYHSIEDTIAARAQGNDGTTRMNLMTYCDQVVTKITKGATGKFWCGDSAGAVKFGSSYLPTSIMDRGLVKGTGLDKM
ncbi:hydroxybutyrate dehydrogenase, putative [Talaromyces stipitatus ATCC 10500]|uniref:Hydroxybutyrate dehydrogenase, putative n=1 Tax=Talaromyces stipitatus (strain ATCC 10500 / CBS 375.48 / QM 6759 / NRRL 1006) TaxID=441959 RepID=B8M5R2_TALSN|nr:hydroxybutyrate dehydrogenase, putative [Talaromyces stipitatus ATCC 10500]EED20039.1 hydroxybutyrate dehydrogenase, putative [Talaromyces stipitatus ATCC 10500]